MWRRISACDATSHVTRTPSHVVLNLPYLDEKRTSEIHCPNEEREQQTAQVQNSWVREFECTNDMLNNTKRPCYIFQVHSFVSQRKTTTLNNHDMAEKAADQEPEETATDRQKMEVRIKQNSATTFVFSRQTRNLPCPCNQMAGCVIERNKMGSPVSDLAKTFASVVHRKMAKIRTKRSWCILFCWESVVPFRMRAHSLFITFTKKSSKM